MAILVIISTVIYAVSDLLFFSFSASMLFAEQQEGYWACKNLLHTPKSNKIFAFEMSHLTRSNQKAWPF